MLICPNCAQERDERDVICVHCGHAGALAATTPPPVVIPPAALVPVKASPGRAKAAPGQARAAVVLGVVAIGVMTVAVFMMRSPRSEEHERATAAAPVAAPAPAPPRKPAAPVAVPVVASEQAAPSKWQRTRQSRWATDGSPTMGFELRAERDVTVYMARVRPILAVRCLARSTEVFVVLQSSASVESAGDMHTVKISLDGEPDVEQQWLDSSDKQALFAPDGETLAARIATSHSLRFSFKPFNAAPAVVEFDVHGLDEPLTSMSKTCRASTRSATTGSTRVARKVGG